MEKTCTLLISPDGHTATASLASLTDFPEMRRHAAHADHNCLIDGSQVEKVCVDLGAQ